MVATQRFFIFTPKIGEDEPILTNIFEMGWDHQLAWEIPSFFLGPFFGSNPTPTRWLQGQMDDWHSFFGGCFYVYVHICTSWNNAGHMLAICLPLGLTWAFCQFFFQLPWLFFEEIAWCHPNINKMSVQPEKPHMSSLKLTWHLKIDGWNTIVVFWGQKEPFFRGEL